MAENNMLKRNFIKSFSDEASNLNGTEFEYICSPIFSMILKEEVEHKGHNLYGKPVGYSADFLADNYSVVGQCGTEPNYFDDFNKPIKDITRAIANHPNAETIYLFANQRGTGGKLTGLDAAIDAENFNKTVIVYDSEKLAKEVLGNINATVRIEEVLSYLPKTREFYKILPQSNKLPSFKSRYYERDDEKVIIEKLETNAYVQIFGVSGIGKTELSISIANQQKDKFDTIIWLDGESIESEHFNLSSVEIAKFNSTINLEFLLQRHKTLLLVDNLNVNVPTFIQEFESNNNFDSKCIITSLQCNVSEGHGYNLGYLDENIAKEILLSTNPKPSNEEVQNIVDNVLGYPLILMLIKSAVEVNEFTWQEILNELGSLKDFTDDKNIKLSDRIIGKFLESFSRELTLFNLLDNRKLSRHFVENVLGKVGVNALGKRSLINVRDFHFFSMHQLILDSIKEKTRKEEHKEHYYTKLSEYLELFNEVKSISYFNFLLTHKEFVMVAYSDGSDDLKKLILYALIQSSDFFSQPEWINVELEKFEFQPLVNYQDLLLFIEQSEIRLFQLEIGSEQHEKASNEIISSMENLLESVTDQQFERVLLHHTGKFYAKKKDLVKAKEYFLRVLEIDEEADYCLLQLARIDVKNRDFVSASDKIKRVLSNEINLEEQSLAILLSFYELLANNNLKDVRTQFIDNNEEFFLKILLSSLDSSFDHPYRVLERLSSHLAYQVSDVYKTICESLPFPSNAQSSRQLKFGYATIQLSYYKLLKYSGEDAADVNDKMEKAYSVSEKYFLSSGLENDFDRKKLLDLYIQSNELDKAEVLLESFDDKESPFYLQNECKVKRLKGDYNPALVSISKAIENGESIAEFHMAALLNDKAETLREMENAECITTLEEAISKQNTRKTIANWTAKKEGWEKHFGNV